MVAPQSIPITPVGPRTTPVMTGTTMAIIVGRTISFRLALVHRSTHLAYSASTLPSMSPLISRNWRRTAEAGEEPAGNEGEGHEPGQEAQRGHNAQDHEHAGPSLPSLDPAAFPFYAGGVAVTAQVGKELLQPLL